MGEGAMYSEILKELSVAHECQYTSAFSEGLAPEVRAMMCGPYAVHIALKMVGAEAASPRAVLDDLLQNGRSPQNRVWAMYDGPAGEWGVPVAAYEPEVLGDNASIAAQKILTHLSVSAHSKLYYPSEEDQKVKELRFVEGQEPFFPDISMGGGSDARAILAYLLRQGLQAHLVEFRPATHTGQIFHPDNHHIVHNPDEFLSILGGVNAEGRLVLRYPQGPFDRSGSQNTIQFVGPTAGIASVNRVSGSTHLLAFMVGHGRERFFVVDPAYPQDQGVCDCDAAEFVYQLAHSERNQGHFIVVGKQANVSASAWRND